MLSAMVIDWNRTSIRIGGVVGRIRCETDWQLDPDWSSRLNDCDLWLVWAGRGQMRIDGGEPIVLRPGVCLWMRPGHVYRGTHEPSDRLGVTFVHFDLVDARGRRRKLADAALPPIAHDVDDLAFADSAARRIVDLVRHARTQADDESDAAAAVAAAESMLRGLLIDLDRSAARPRPRPASADAAHVQRMIGKLASTIRENPADAPPVALMARGVRMSPDHFARCFKRVTGLNPSAFVIESRIARARQLLSETALPVSRIARLLGYRDIYFFSRQFRDKTGIPPTDYRRRA